MDSMWWISMRTMLCEKAGRCERGGQTRDRDIRDASRGWDPGHDVRPLLSVALAGDGRLHRARRTCAVRITVFVYFSLPAMSSDV